MIKQHTITQTMADQERSDFFAVFTTILNEITSLKNMCAVHGGLCNALEGYHQCIGGYYKCIESCPVHQCIGDVMSALGLLSSLGRYHQCIGGYHQCIGRYYQCIEDSSVHWGYTIIVVEHS